jgi:uncharacterized protein involved in response to NO
MTSSLRGYRGPAFLSLGFRPFFLGGAVWAAVGIAVWLPFWFGEWQVPTAFAPVDWHVHEMLYGYVPAIIGGVLLTAIPNWTGRLPLRGGALAALVVAWLAGRVAVGTSAVTGPVVAAAVDCGFLLLLILAVSREVIAGRNWKNLAPVGLVTVFFVGDVVFHIEAGWAGSAAVGARIGVAAAVLLVALIGGRVIPSFTRNWLARENPGRLPVPLGRLDGAVLAVSVVALAVWVALPERVFTGGLMLAAGAAHAVRLARWAGDRTLRSPLTLVLHVAYGFIPVGFGLLGWSGLDPEAIPMSAGIHAWTVGALGMMTVAMMTRVSLGHTGRALSAGLLTLVIYVAVGIAALVRVLAAFEPGWSVGLLWVAGSAWVVAFVLFIGGYGASLMRPRVG